MKKYVYLFKEGNKDMRNLLGGKGANLAEMKNMGLPVPNGFTITTEACTKYYEDNQIIDTQIEAEILDTITKLEIETGKKLGHKENPLLLSVRSGSPISMPGMMDTILNLGLNDEIARYLSKDEASIRFIYDSYRRLIMMFADVVRGKGKEEFEKIIEEKKRKRHVQTDIELTAEDMYDIAMESKKVYRKLTKEPFPENPREQLLESVKAVFRSWNTERAKIYRKMNNISDNLGTAVNVQEMVYGNLTDDSLTGVAFSRNPSTGENILYGEYLEKAQGEDIVSGVRTPKSVEAMERDYPEIYNELKGISKILEKHYKDMQDMEFTAEKGKLYILQTRSGKRTTKSALTIAVDMVNEGLITKEDAIMRIEPEKLNELLHPIFDEKSLKDAITITKGLPASPGAVSGKIYFNVKDVVNAKKQGINPILVRNETSPEDIEGMNTAVGILTVRGGMTSHAAVVARGIGRCCVSGCHELIVNEETKTMMIKGKVYREGDNISLDGSSGIVYEGLIKTSDINISGDFEIIMNWAKEIKKLDVRANAETKQDAIMAFKFGAEGLGLARTEHMFFEENKLFAIRKMIVARTKEERNKALKELMPIQRHDFEKIFRVSNGHKVTIRYLDPPLHEFLPKTEKDIDKLAALLNITEEELTENIKNLKEVNPMMGHRGCRLAITYPEIILMQTTAIIEAAIAVIKEGYQPYPELMIPLVGDVNEFMYLKNIIIEAINQIFESYQMKIDYEIGTMIEVPRGAVEADKLAKEASFFSFGTNDLTQMTYGFSRDDAGKFLEDYYQKNIFKKDPFKTIDKDGVGKLIIVATSLAKKTNPNIELGICGEHGGDPESIEFFNKVGLNYVSCSPYRVPVAILAAARAVIKENK
ncbi:MAG: pyruvate, phosphate dikinase [Bacilli bacterium]|nr:pyruvate, phosphate dikinase [Bacilli bacterium]